MKLELFCIAGIFCVLLTEVAGQQPPFQASACDTLLPPGVTAQPGTAPIFFGTPAVSSYTPGNPINVIIAVTGGGLNLRQCIMQVRRTDNGNPVDEFTLPPNFEYVTCRASTTGTVVGTFPQGTTQITNLQWNAAMAVGEVELRASCQDATGNFWSLPSVLLPGPPPEGLTIECPTPNTPGANGVATYNPATTFCMRNNAIVGVATCTPPSGTTFSPGTTTVTCTCSDGGENAECSFTVTIDVPGLTVNCPTPNTDNTGFTTYDPAFTLCMRNGVPVALATCTPPSETTFSPGTTTVTCTCSNGGETAQCSFTVTVDGNTPPDLTCPMGDTTTDSLIVSCNDIEDGSITPTCTPPIGTTFGPGSTDVNCVCTDSGGLTATCQFNVIPEGLTIDCPTPNTPGANGVTTYNPATTLCMRNSVPVAVATCSPPSGTTFSPGTTTVTCTCSNGGETAQCSFPVIVDGGPMLTINCPTPDTGANGVTTYNPATTLCMRNGVPVTVATCSPVSGTTFSSGTTTVTCMCSNGGENAECSFPVTIGGGVGCTPNPCQGGAECRPAAVQAGYTCHIEIGQPCI